MLSSLLVAVSLQQSPVYEKNAGAVISKMFQRYHSAQSARGTIQSESSDDGGAVKFVTEFAYERPSKIYVTQNRKSSNGLNYLLVSDGVNFSYDPPRNSPIKPKPYERFYEKVSVDRVVERGARSVVEKYSQSVGEIYAVGHSSLDYCVTLDVVVAFDAHLKDFKTIAATYQLVGMEDYKGKKAYRIVGDWRPRTDAPATGTYSMLISQDFDMLTFSLKERYQVGARPVNYSLSEVCDIRLGEPIPADLFRVK